MRHAELTNSRSKGGIADRTQGALREVKHVAHHIGLPVSEGIVAHSAPLVVVEDFQPPYVGQFAVSRCKPYLE